MSALERLRIVVGGMIAGAPGHGGATWAVLQYLLGFRRLGHDVYFVEDMHARDRSQRVSLGGTRAASWCEVVMRHFGLDGCWTLVGTDGVTAGASRERLGAFCREADVLVDLSGVAARVDEAMSVPTRLYVDLDPGFTQAWQSDGVDMGIAAHTHHASVGTGLGAADSMIPALGVAWIPTLPPVVLDEWRADTPVVRDAITTIGNWRSYGPVSIDGMTLGQRAHSMRALVDLPRLTGDRFAVALAIHPGDRDDASALRKHGWELLDPGAVAATPWAYHRFITASRAEIGVAKHGYVVARTGWFSDRSACYLAAGRPVVTHDTGRTGGLPTGIGLLVFGSVDEAAEAIRQIDRDRRKHARAARAIAEEFLDSDRVLSRLLSTVSAS